MNNFTEKILATLRESRHWAPGTKEKSGTISGLICPACGDKTAWAYTESPMSINCNRLSSCGARTRTLDLFPELRRNVERDFPATKSDPDRPSREWLHMRGIPDSLLQGLLYRYLPNVRKTGSGACMFFVGIDKNGKRLENGRLFNPPEGEGKANNIGSTAGQYWQHPGFAYDYSKKLWIVEGILDALSLLALGQQAIACLSAGQDPAKIDLAKFTGGIVISFDNDAAGHRACKKWLQYYQGAEVILCDPGQDWNDFLQSGPLDTLKTRLRENMPRYQHNGRLALASDPQQYADIYSEFHNKAPGLFAFNHCTYFAEKKVSRATGESFIAVHLCVKATVETVCFLLNRSNPAKPEYQYHLLIHPAKGRRIPATATGADLATHRRVKEFFLAYAASNWEGDAKACTALASQITDDKKAPEVKELAVTGYQPENDAYIFDKWAIDPAGRHLHPDKRGFFLIGNQYYQAATHAHAKAILPAGINKEQARKIYQLIADAWGNNGIVALSWTLASWLVNQIKKEVNFFPFLSLHGDPASGKSALVTILNAIQGREGEGLPVTQLNSKKGLTRTIGQLSGLFTALLEDNQRNEKGFDYSILLTAYNRGPLQVQAAFSNDSQTRETPFLGTLLFVQNTEPFNSKQEKQRVISLHFRSDDLTDSSRAAYVALLDLPPSELAGIILLILQNRQHFAAWPEVFKQAISILGPMDERRILENHALIYSFYQLFCSFLGIDHNEAVTDYFRELGILKCSSSAERTATIADHFFEQLDTIDNDKAPEAFNINIQKGWLAVNLTKAENLLRNKGLNVQANETLLRALQAHPAFLASSKLYRFPDTPEIDGKGRPKQRRAWIFDLKWFEQQDETAAHRYGQ